MGQAQAVQLWNFSYSTSGSTFFTGTLTSDGSSYTTNTIYNLTGISGTITDFIDIDPDPINTDFQRVNSSVSTVDSDFGGDNLFVWNGTTGISLTSNGIAFSSFYSLVSNRYRIHGLNSGSGSTLGDFKEEGLAEWSTRTAYFVSSSSLTPTAVPWETDALPVISSTILFAGGLWARNKFAKPLQK
jgi:hypothetical protein